MNLTILELLVLKETPSPGEILQRSGCRSDITTRALARLSDPGTEGRTVLKVIDGLEARGYVQRVNVGFFRKTYEGEQALYHGARTLQDIASRLAS